MNKSGFRSYVAIDFETSAPSGACACAIGMARFENYQVSDTFYRLIRPASSRIWYSSVHGLYWKDLKDQPLFDELWPEIAAFIAGAEYFIAHNARFDRKVMMECCDAYSLSRPNQPFLCTVKGARAGLRLASNNLGTVCEYFHIPLNHHHAASDARACGEIHARLRQLGVADEAMLLDRPNARKLKTN